MQITNPLATIRPCTIKTFTMPFFKIGIKVMISMVMVLVITMVIMITLATLMSRGTSRTKGEPE